MENPHLDIIKENTQIAKQHLYTITTFDLCMGIHLHVCARIHCWMPGHGGQRKVISSHWLSRVSHSLRERKQSETSKDGSKRRESPGHQLRKCDAIYGGTEDTALHFLFKPTSSKRKKRGREVRRERLGRCWRERGRRKGWSQGECAS